MRERAASNNGLLPDNVGPNGTVSELRGGNWFGGHYGWAWPHGLHSVEAAATIAATNQTIVTGRTDALDLARVPLDTVIGKGVVEAGAASRGSMGWGWAQKMGVADDVPVQLVSYRHNSAGWFDFRPADLPGLAVVAQLRAQRPGPARVPGIQRRFQLAGHEVVPRQERTRPRGAPAGLPARPIWCSGTTPHYASQTDLFPWAYDVPVAAGGMLCLPGDVVVADDDGAVIVPSAKALELVEDAEDHENWRTSAGCASSRAAGSPTTTRSARTAAPSTRRGAARSDEPQPARLVCRRGDRDPPQNRPVGQSLRRTGRRDVDRLSQVGRPPGRARPA